MMAAIVALAVAVVVVTVIGWRVLNWVWFAPRKLEKQLRRQGFRGNSYKLMYGDAREMMLMTIEAKSKPINLSHDIAPRVMPYIHNSVINHGKFFFGWLGPKPMVHFMDPELIKEVLSNYNQFQKRLAGNPLAKLLVRGLVFLEGEKWAKHRKIIRPAFHLEKLKLMLPAYHSCCTAMIDKWEEIVSKESRGSVELDVWPYLQTLSADVLSRTAFGISYDEGKKILDLQKEQAVLSLEASQSIYIPGSRYLPFKRNRRMKEIAKDVRGLIHDIIDRRLQAMKAGETTKDDLLSVLLESNYKEIEQQGKKNSGLTIEEVIEECKLFYFAGQETTASLFVWTMILLSWHQNWQTKAREEVFHVFGDKLPDQDGLNHLKIVSMILNEVLRLYPPAVMLHRKTDEEIKVGDITLPAGVTIQLPIMMLHHDRGLWGDDANEFKPERFSEGVSNVTKGQASYLPFGGGPRICIGQNFAILEAKIAVAMILQRFSFALSTSYSHAPHTVTSLQPQFGAHLILQKL